jgi:hypothetical protein
MKVLVTGHAADAGAVGRPVAGHADYHDVAPPSKPKAFQ